jgi:endonuclease/exonuclease/phosphatase family metal-dependent hydrolase
MKQRFVPVFTALVVAAVQASAVGVLVFTLQPFGARGPTFLGVAGVLGGLECLRRFKPTRDVSGAPGARLPWKRGSILTRRPLGLLLLGWLCLIGWAEISPGGQDVPPKADSAEIRIVSWNILRGGDRDWPWLRGGWPTRKHALASALGTVRPDILCVQEARPQQVAFLEAILPDHLRVGVGRDDGAGGGEHCAIFFNRARFQKVEEQTFWLEDPSDRPAGWRITGPKRICTWVRLCDRRTGRTFRVLNTHLYLTEASRQRAARMILERLGQGNQAEPILLAADFNATEQAPSRRLFADAKLASTSFLADQPTQPTYQFYGISLRNLDEILAGPGWKVRQHAVVTLKPGNRYPSDHFGVLADLVLDPGERVD